MGRSWGLALKNVVLSWCSERVGFAGSTETNVVWFGAVGLEATGRKEEKLLVSGGLGIFPLNVEAMRSDSNCESCRSGLFE